MSETLTFAVEIAVGAACLAAAGGAWHRSRTLAVVLLVAGLAAVGHGVIALAS